MLILTHKIRVLYKGFPGGSMVKNLPANAGDTGNEGLIPGLGKSPGEGNGNPLQYSCLENPMDRGAWQAAVHGVEKSRSRLSTHAFFSLSEGPGGNNPQVSGVFPSLYNITRRFLLQSVLP